MTINFFRAVSLAIALGVGYSLYGFPLGGIALLGGLLAYILLLLRFSRAWMIVLPVLLPLLDLSPWSGRIVFNEFDFFVSVTLATALWRGRLSFSFLDHSACKWGLLALTVSHILAGVAGLFALRNNGVELFQVYHGAANLVRVDKGFWEALALLPLLDYERKRGNSWGYYFSAGMAGALLAFVLVVVWEKMAFSGLLNVKSSYRITGLFSGMLLSGSVVDGFLVLTFPFILVCFRGNRHPLLFFCGLFLSLGALFCFVANHSLSTFLAFAIAVAILARGEKLTQWISAETWPRLVLAILIVFGFFAPILFAAATQSRLDSASPGQANRVGQWRHAMRLMGGSFSSYVFGEGTGVFPKKYFQDSADISSFSLKPDAGNGAVLRFSASDESGGLAVRQRFFLEEEGVYRITVKARTENPGRESLLMQICMRNISAADGECPFVEAVIDSKPGQWATYSETVKLGGYANALSRYLKPVEIEVIDRGLPQPVDIGEVQVFSPTGKPLLRNADFSRGFDFWMFSSDDYRAWHINNQALAIFFENGLIGALVFCAVLLALFGRACNMVSKQNPYGTVLMASLCGISVVCLFGSPFDDPRISWLFYLLAAVVMLEPKQNPGEDAFRIPWKRFSKYMGLIMLVGGLFATVYLMHAHDAGVRQLLSEGRKQLMKKMPMLAGWLKPEAKFSRLAFDGRLRTSHPRIVLPQIANWQGQAVHPLIAERLEQYAANGIRYISACGSEALLDLTSCQLTQNSQENVEKIRRKMLDFQTTDQTDSDEVSNAWELALAYDLAFPLLEQSERVIVETKLAEALRRTLDILDEDKVSLWHSRVSHAAVAWLCAVALDGDASAASPELKNRAQGHFLEAMKALTFTEAWPEGYNYWINSRGFLFSLAASAYVNGLEDARESDKIKQIMLKVGYWHIYATRPDSRIEGYADEGPRVDLLDETRRVIDLLAQLTREPVLAGYSAYLEKLYGADSYYGEYRWSFLLGNDPSVPRAGDGSMQTLGRYLPTARLFGLNSVNNAFVHAGWGPDGTFVSYRAGHDFSHHGHYDAGHFTLFKGAPLIVNSSSYNGDVFSSHRLNYSIRTVAKNSLLVQRPGEIVKPNHFFKENVADGGQRITMPTGAAIASVEDWYLNYHANQHFEAAELLNYVNGRNFTLISSDLTPAYNNQDFDTENKGGKVVSVIRNLVYLRDEDILVVYDTLKATDENYKQKLLLHTVQRPEITGLKVLKGTEDNGILESGANEALVSNGAGRLVVTRLLPAEGSIRLIGGRDFAYYVETDGDDAVLDGKNYNQGASGQKPWFDNAQWRMEFSPATAAADNQFLLVLSPSMDNYRRRPIKSINVPDKSAVGLETDKSAMLFLKPGDRNQIVFTLSAGKKKLFMFGGEFDNGITVQANGKPAAFQQEKFSKAVELTFESELNGEVTLNLR